MRFFFFVVLLLFPDLFLQSIPFRTAVDDINNLYNGWYTQRANNIAHLPNAATQVAGTGALGRNHKRMGDCNARSVQCRARSLEGLAPTAAAHAARRGLEEKLFQTARELKYLFN